MTSEIYNDNVKIKLDNSSEFKNDLEEKIKEIIEESIVIDKIETVSDKLESINRSHFVDNNIEFKRLNVEEKISVCKDCEYLIIPASQYVCASFFCFNYKVQLLPNTVINVSDKKIVVICVGKVYH